MANFFRKNFHTQKKPRWWRGFKLLDINYIQKYYTLLAINSNIRYFEPYLNLHPFRLLELAMPICGHRKEW